MCTDNYYFPEDGCKDCGVYCDQAHKIFRGFLIWHDSEWLCMTCIRKRSVEKMMQLIRETTE